ncbi:MAG: NTP transferase domain-containing protein [Pseudonocardia sp.]
MTAVTGLLLAAGAGRRFGRPKALVELEGEPLVRRALRVLRDGGCAPLVVVLGAAADEVAPLLPADATAVVADGWAEGMGASLRAGLDALAEDAALVHLVDLPGVTATAVARLVAAAQGPQTLARAAYDGRPGHPVLLGRDHWPGVRESATGDAGAREYLRTHAVLAVECGDVATPDDADTPESLARFRGA